LAAPNPGGPLQWCQQSCADPPLAPPPPARRSALLAAGHFSATSSVVAEASLHEHDACSVDNVSLADSEQVERLGLDWVEVEGQMVLEAAPLAGRLVLFLSGAVEHAVMPCHGEMVTVSAWCQ
jgi:hypothetical protein